MVVKRLPYTEALQAALEAVTHDERTVHAQIVEAQARLAELQVERRGLELSLRRYASDVTVTAVQSGSTTHWSIDDETTTTEEQTAERAGELTEVEAAEAAENPDSENRQPAAGTMTDIVADILRQATGPIGPQEVAIELKKLGMPQEDTVQVRGTLGYLNRKGLLRKLGRGQWVLRGSQADRVAPEDDIFGDIHVPTDEDVPTSTETSTADAVEVSGEVPSQEEGGRQLVPVMATG